MFSRCQRQKSLSPKLFYPIPQDHAVEECEMMRGFERGAFVAVEDKEEKLLLQLHCL